MGSGVDEDPPGGVVPRRRRGLARAAWVVLAVFLCVVLAEATARSYWRLRSGIPFRHPGRILHAYYPELKSVDEKRPSREDERFDILFLGGSALHRDWGHVEQNLREQLAFEGHRHVRVFNLAMPGHTSRDSRLKYEALADVRFELIVFYHGINEARANNVPPELFRDDYAHYSWYEIVNAMATYHGRTSVALPYTLHHAALDLKHLLTEDRYVPTRLPRPDWIGYGSDPKSAASFERNLEAILDLAALRGERVLLMTFATWVPEDYSLEAFRADALGYGLHLNPIETWGSPEHVLDAVAAHNAVVRRLADLREGLLFVDQAARMVAVPTDFNDPCHFTAAGSAKFAGSMVEALRPLLSSPAPEKKVGD